MSDQEKNQKEFLKALSKLSIKHGITIAGCGCCGSPFLVKQDSTIKGHYIVGGDDDLRFIHE